MANQEVVNAINETMVPNGVKAINADSVRNLLLLMAEKMGEGTGSGAVKVHILPSESIDFSQIDFDNLEDIEQFTPEEAELIKNMFLKVQQDNIAAYKLLNEHKEQGIADLVMGDQSFFGTLLLTSIIRSYGEMLNQVYPDMNVDWSSLSFNGVSGIPLVYANIDADTSGLDENSLIMFEEFLMSEGDTTFNEISLFDPSDEYGTYTLMEDGSVMYKNDEPEPIVEYMPIIYLSGQDGELTEEMIEANKRATNVSDAYIGVHWSVRYVTENVFFEKGGCVHEIVPTYDHLNNKTTHFRFWKEKNIMQVSIDEDGTATLEVYASINPTA